MKLRIEFDCDNAAFGEDPEEECQQLLRKIVTQLDYTASGPIIDSNGNRVGEWSLR